MGLGATESSVPSSQNSIISLYRYCCLSKDKPEGEISSAVRQSGTCFPLGDSILNSTTFDWMDVLHMTMAGFLLESWNIGISSQQPAESLLEMVCPVVCWDQQFPVVLSCQYRVVVFCSLSTDLSDLVNGRHRRIAALLLKGAEVS